MNKNFWQSKTMWGFGLAGLIGIAQVFGVTYSEASVSQIVQILSALLGAYGVRDAI